MGSHMGTLAADAAGNSAWASRTADRSSSSSAPPPPLSRSRTEKFRHLLSVPRVDLTALRTLLWSGAPEDDPTMRAQAWQMLLGYLPPVHERRASGMAKKREEYEELRRQHCHYSGDTSCFIELSRHDGDEVSLQQIRADIPRTSPSLSIFTQPPIQQLMERVLYIWSERHPASGYVQGMNDLATPFIAVLLAAEQNAMLEDLEVDHCVGTTLDAVEAGTYWMLTKFLSDIQDHYTAGQPGIQQMVLKLRDLVRRIDEKLYTHFEKEGLDFMQFSFRWMNCLLIRELPFPCVVRLWDAYIAEPSEGSSSFHVYVCAVFLIYWAPQLKQMDFTQLMLFMQKLPTGNWRTKEIESLLAEAFVLKSLFHSAPKHLSST